ncbi:N,N-dimethylformamidase, small subunit [Aminobacter anthyllidis]|uniref:N,N-dimethylformamidase, small subunit n=1 Tax=Aminobacter anthyllidis TaxID=1035067 RepID=UPI00245790C3|nr:N,N-dimethylformamidase, small subunit [Aminobacter anthyllidis]MDH4984366.1 N,N-dimethylformamidase, small subunit [Aminobacter anthyllidis]
MITIPKKGSPERARLIAEHRACIDSMKGVPGCTILRCATPGDTTHVSGGIHEDLLLNRVLLRMRAAMPRSGRRKLVVICTEPDKSWRIGRLSGVRGVPPEFVNDTIYDNEQDPQHDIFLMRLDELDETDGMPEHFHEGWKRRDDNWTVT